MQLNKETNSAKYQITKYSEHSVTVNDQEFTSAILVMPNHLAPWTVKNVQGLNNENLQVLIDLKPEIILLGTGEELVFPEPKVMQVVYAHKIGVEVMTTAAACRTYAALTGEGRNVLAALMIT